MVEVAKTFKKVEDIVLYRDSRYFSSFPSIITLKNGDVCLFFRRGRDIRNILPSPLPENFQYLTTDIDHVDPRSEISMIRYSSQLTSHGKVEGLPVNIEAGDQDPSVIELSDGTVVMASFSWYPFSAEFMELIGSYRNQMLGDPAKPSLLYIYWGSYTRYSQDGAKSWSPHNYLPPLPDYPPIIPYQRPFHGGPVRGSLVEVGDEVLLATYTTLWKGGPPLTCHLFASEDKGRTWNYRTPIAWDENSTVSFAEPALYRTPSGKIIAFLRTKNLEDDYLATVESLDNGHSWSTWKEHKVKGHPFHPYKLPDGRVFLSYGYRHEPYGIRARILDPECNNIEDAEEIILRDDGFCHDIGYPWSTLLPDGKLCVAYYFSTAEDTTRHIACTVLELK